MSKVSSLTKRAVASPFASKAEAIGTADIILSGKRTISREEATKLFGEAADALDVQFVRMEKNMTAIAEGEIQVAENAKKLMSSGKNLAGQVGDAMARIDKVVVRDFEAKLLQLERFVVAMKELDELQRSGRLGALVSAFANK